MTDLITLPATDLAVALDKARGFAEQAIAPNSRRAYAADWQHFTRWCAAHSASPLPADVATVCAYLADCADCFKVATIERRLTSISKAHSASGMPNPVKSEPVHLTMRGIRRQLGTAQTQKAPVITDVLRAMLDTLPGGIQGTRDRALLLLGWSIQAPARPGRRSKTASSCNAAMFPMRSACSSSKFRSPRAVARLCAMQPASND